jgi:hypothetical protein
MCEHRVGSMSKDITGSTRWRSLTVRSKRALDDAASGIDKPHYRTTRGT